jgi:hypothetical protein
MPHEPRENDMIGAFDVLVFAAFFAPTTVMMGVDLATCRQPSPELTGLLALPEPQAPTPDAMPAPGEVGPHGAFAELRHAA